MAIQESVELTPREYVIMENERDEARLNREHAVTMKQLEIQLQKDKHAASVELKRLEAKWSSLLKLPSILLKLPIYFIFAIGYIVSVIRKQEPSKGFWSYLS